MEDLIQVQKWVCRKIDEENPHEEVCDTIVYVEGQYSLPPNCPECGSDKAMECHGDKYFEEVTF